MNKGWIKLHRSIVDWEWYDDDKTFRCMIHCLLSANIEDKLWRNTVIKRGQFIASVKSIAKAIKASNQQTRTVLNRLKRTNEITIKTTNKWSMITIVNYEKYQEVNKQNNNQSTNKTPDSNKQVTNNQQSNNNQITTTKEYKNIRSKELENKEKIKEHSLFLKFKKIWKDNFPDYIFNDGDLKQLPFAIKYFEKKWKDEKRDFPQCPKFDQDWACQGWNLMIKNASEWNRVQKCSLKYWSNNMNEIYSQSKNSKNSKKKNNEILIDQTTELLNKL